MSEENMALPFNDSAFPPGTVRLKDNAHMTVVLSPQPSSDPNDPLNWSTWRKTKQMALLCLYGILVFGVLTLAVPLWQAMVDELGYTYADLNNSYGVSAATLSLGCVMFVPFALRYGRRPVYIVTCLIMCADAIWSAEMQTIGDLMGTNVVMGLAGSVNETLFQMTVSDLFFVHQRGLMNGIFLICVNIGNYFAPVASGYVAATMGWRWGFWWIAIFLGITSLLLVFFLEETKYIPPATEGILVPTTTRDGRLSMDLSRTGLPDDAAGCNTMALDEKCKTIGERASENNVGIRNDSITSVMYDPRSALKERIVEVDYSIAKRPWRQRYSFYTPSGDQGNSYSWFRHLYQPFALLFLFPAVAFAAVQWAFCLSALSVVAVSQSDLYPYPPYNFSTAGVGLTNIPPAIGAILGALWGGPVVDWFIVRLANRNDGIYEPEMRLYLFALPAVVMPIGVFIYGLTIAQGMPWIINFVGSGLIGFGIGGVGDIALTYLQDSYLEILPDALVGVAFVRNIMATILVFAITPWFDGMGIYNAFVLLGCISVAFSLTAVPMLIWGKTWRSKYAERYRYYARKQFVIRSI